MAGATFDLCVFVDFAENAVPLACRLQVLEKLERLQ